MVNIMKSSKNKIGIITLYHGNCNFGGLLQAYALPKVLKEHFGIEAEQIDYVPTVQSVKEEQDNKKGIAKCFYQIIYNFGIFFFDKVNKKKLNRRKQAFDSFINEIPHGETPCDYYTINESLNRYGVFVCGGDQIWNDFKEDQNIEVYTLQFVPSGYKKIAYAPSMAVLEASSSFKKVMRNGLNGLDAVSVREKKSLSILQQLTDKNIEVVADPVLLMTADEWTRSARETKNKGKYVLCYLLGDSTQQREAVKKAAK